MVNLNMKGKTVCPNCKENFVIDLPKDEEKHKVSCPNCRYEFNVRPSCNKEGDDCSWEEYGEPRKTILSAIKPETRKPFIAVILLLIVFSVGITTAVFSEVFIESSLDLASDMGFTGDVKLVITDEENNSLDQIDVYINGNKIEHQSNGTYYEKELEPGVQTIQLESSSGFKNQEMELLIPPFITTEKEIVMQEGPGDAKKVYFDTLGCSVIILIFSVFALLSMISCMKHQHFDLAVAGSFIAIFSFGFFFIGSILSIIAFILIILSRDEFENGETGKLF